MYYSYFSSEREKLDSSFLDSQFSIPGYRMIREDKNQDGMIFCINEEMKI